MKKSLLFLSSFFTLTTGIFAQTIISSITAPSVGSSITVKAVSLTNPIDMSTAGNNAVWNFTVDLSAAQTSSFSIITPASSPYSALFSGATHCEKTEAGSYAYYKYTASTIDLLGVYSSTAKTYSNSMLVMKTPMSLNTSYSDTFGGVYNLNTIPTYNKGTITTSYDGFGKVTLNGTTYNNVIRLKQHKVEIDSIDYYGIMYNITVTTSDSYAFTIDGNNTLFAYTVINMKSDFTQTGDGDTGDEFDNLRTAIDEDEGDDEDYGSTDITVYSFIVYPALVTSVHDKAAIADLAVAPNPTQGTVTISLDHAMSGLQAEVYDATGTPVFTKNISGALTSHVDLSDLTAGVYILKISNADHQEIRRIVKQ